MNVKVKGHEGIAFYAATTCIEEGHDSDCMVVMMVGDDYEWHVNEEDIEGLKEDEFCPSCGQIGCGWR